MDLGLCKLHEMPENRQRTGQIIGSCLAVRQKGDYHTQLPAAEKRTARDLFAVSVVIATETAIK
jgi:hypothetical protein